MQRQSKKVKGAETTGTDGKRQQRGMQYEEEASEGRISKKR